MRVDARHGPSDGGTSVWRRPRWPDGRIISPLDDGIPHWIRVLAVAPLMVWIWMAGQSGSLVSATVPDAPMVLVSLLIAAVCCWLESNRRFWALAEASPPAVVGDAQLLTAASDTRTLWPLARWPDGRYVGGGDRVAEVLKWFGLSLGMAAIWVFGSVDVAGVDIGHWWAGPGSLLTAPTAVLGWVSSTRVRALAESATAEDAGRQPPSE